jgi:hypothetical protein
VHPAIIRVFCYQMMHKKYYLFYVNLFSKFLIIAVVVATFIIARLITYAAKTATLTTMVHFNQMFLTL